MQISFLEIIFQIDIIIKMKLIILALIGSFILSSCNTVVGTAKGVGRDAKAIYIYSRDSITSRPVSDK